MSRSHPACHANGLRDIWLVAVLLIISRSVYWSLGVRFDATPLEEFWQYIDPLLLKDQLLESLFYFHAQPPLFNLFLGVWVKLLGSQAHWGFWGSYLLLSLSGLWAMLRLFRIFGFSRSASLALLLVYMLSPTAIAYEHWLFYTWPVAMLLLVSAYFMHEYLWQGKQWQSLAVFSVIAAIALIRSAFHLLWIVGMIVLILRARPVLWKRTCLGAAVCLLVVGGVYVKNAVVFSSFSSSSWMWINFSQTARLPAPRQEALIEEGKLSPLARLWGFSPPEEYAPFITLSPPSRDLAVLNDIRKSTGAPNMNHRIYLAVSALRQRDDLYIVTHYPEVYLKNVLAAFLIFTMPSTDYSFVQGNIAPIRPLERLYNLLLYGKIPSSLQNWLAHTVLLKHVYEMGVVVFLALLGTAIYTGRVLWRCARTHQPPNAEEAVLLYMGLTILFIAVIGSLFEIKENNRFKVMIEPLLFLSTAVWLSRLSRKIVNRLA